MRFLTRHILRLFRTNLLRRDAAGVFVVPLLTFSGHHHASPSHDRGSCGHCSSHGWPAEAAFTHCARYTVTEIGVKPYTPRVWTHKRHI